MGVGLRLAHPNLPSCEDCKRFMIDTKTWTPLVPQGRNEPTLRPKGTPTPCWQCPKIPKGAKPCPENAQQLSTKNQQALWWYWRTKADGAGALPQDEVSLRNNAIIAMVMESHDRIVRDSIPMILAKTPRL